MKKLLSFGCSVLMLLFFFTCEVRGEDVYIGHTISLKISGSTLESRSNFRWTTSNDNVSIVSETAGECVIRGEKEGSCTVRCDYKSMNISNSTYEDKHEDFYITVRPGSDDITITPSKAEIAVGETKEFKATVSGSSSYTMTWTSANKSIAEVISSSKSSCTIKGKGPGTTHITAKTSYGSEASFPVTVYDSPTGVKVSTREGETVVYIGWFVQMKAELIPSTSRSTITWSVDNSNVATIGQDGYLVTLNPGKVTVFATTANGVKGQLQLEVRDHPFYLESSNPVNGATDVPLDIQPRMTFTHDVELNYNYSKFYIDNIRLENVDDGYKKVDRELHIEGASVWLVPQKPLLPKTRYRFIINIKYLKSVQTGEPNSKDFIVEFTTADIPLTMTGTSPINGAMKVPLDVQPLISFSTGVGLNYDNTNLDFENICLKEDDGTTVTRTLNSDGGSYWIKPDKPLKPNTHYTMIIPAGYIKILKTGTPSTEDFSFSFTTRLDDDNTEELTGTFSISNVENGILQGNVANLVVELVNPIRFSSKGHFGFYYYSGEDMKLDYSWWPTENRNEIIAKPGTNVFHFERNTSTFPCKFRAVFYQDTENIIELGSVVINSHLTEINKLTSEPSCFDIYNLQGHKIRSKVSTTDGLPKGIYIVNGKKKVVQ